MSIIIFSFHCPGLICHLIIDYRNLWMVSILFFYPLLENCRKTVVNNVHLSIADKIIERASKLGIPTKDIIIDPLVLTVGADSKAGEVTLETIKQVKEKFGVNINLGASNVSFGLPDRHTLNQAFLALAIGAGATCAITDPMKLTSIIRASDLLVGKDSNGSRYISYWRTHKQDAA